MVAGWYASRAARCPAAVSTERIMLISTELNSRPSSSSTIADSTTVLVGTTSKPSATVSFFRRGCWGRGYASEVVSSLLPHGARQHGLLRVIATVAPDNAASQRVLAKAGMARGALRDNADGTRTQLFAWVPPPG
jgi:hypothetical protein